MKCRFTIIFLLLVYQLSNLYPSPQVSISTHGLTVTQKDISINQNFIMSTKQKQLTALDYVSDAFILHGSLFLAMGLTVPLQDSSFRFVSSGEEFVDRLLFEPFAIDRQENLLSLLRDNNGNLIRDFQGKPINAPNGRFFIKNMIEPGSFYLMALYLRSKNYHPALYFGYVFTLSFLYQFTVTPLFTQSSFEQLLKNPVIGTTVALLTDEIATYFLSTDKAALHVIAYVLNPFKLLPNARVRPLLFIEPYQKRISLEVSFDL